MAARTHASRMFPPASNTVNATVNFQTQFPACNTSASVSSAPPIRTIRSMHLRMRFDKSRWYLSEWFDPFVWLEPDEGPVLIAGASLNVDPAMGEMSTVKFMIPSLGRSGEGGTNSAEHSDVTRVPAPHCTVHSAPLSQRPSCIRTLRTSFPLRPSQRSIRLLLLLLISPKSSLPSSSSSSSFRFECIGAKRSTHDSGSILSMYSMYFFMR
mmetsp:Transcript_2344/g.5380  ORF Transcript_2344/g.5380 Transcript_2344/m.5380 type:complete len:211 (+) Transcript_2344:117-749(+)